MDLLDDDFTARAELSNCSVRRRSASRPTNRAWKMVSARCGLMMTASPRRYGYTSCTSRLTRLTAGSTAHLSDKRGRSRVSVSMRVKGASRAAARGGCAARSDCPARRVGGGRSRGEAHDMEPWHLYAEVARQTMGWRFAATEDRKARSRG